MSYTGAELYGTHGKLYANDDHEVSVMAMVKLPRFEHPGGLKCSDDVNNDVTVLMTLLTTNGVIDWLVLFRSIAVYCSSFGILQNCSITAAPTQFHIL